MSDDRFEQEEAKDDDDVEAHKHRFSANDEPGSGESEDVEAHRHKGFR